MSVRNKRIPLVGKSSATNKIGLKNLRERYGLLGLQPIVKDEERSFMRLRRLLLQIDETLDIEGPVTNVSDTVEALRREYDIIFADIRLDDGDVFEDFLQFSPPPTTSMPWKHSEAMA